MHADHSSLWKLIIASHPMATAHSPLHEKRYYYLIMQLAASASIVLGLLALVVSINLPIVDYFDCFSSISLLVFKIKYLKYNYYH